MDAGEIKLTLNGAEVTKPLKIVLGGDGKYQSSAIMHQGAGATFGCHRCECPTAHFMVTDPAVLATFPRRTLQRIKELGHMVPGITCEGCGLMVVATQAEADRLNAGKPKTKHVAIRVCTGDPLVDPPKPWKSKKKITWEQAHKSIYYGGDGWHLVWDAELSKWVGGVFFAR